MLGKMILPLAIGGGLVFLLASSSSASAAPAAQNPLNALPDDLKQLSGQALGTNDPGMLEQVAGQLEARGFPDQGRLLRGQAASIRQQRGIPAAPVSGPPPMSSLVSSPGIANPPAASPAPPPAPASSSAAAPIATPAPAMSPQLQQMIMDAIKNGTAPALTSTAFVVDAAGFPGAADDLRQRAKAAAATVAPPAPQDRPNVALDPSMPADLALEVARQLQLQGDPTMLEGLAAELRKRGFNATADQLEAKAKQIRAALDAARTMNAIDQEFKSPGIMPQSPSFNPAPSAPVAPPAAPAPIPQPPPASPAPAPAPVATFPTTIVATPPGPIPVPSVPQPQPVPQEKSKAQILAETVASSLNDLIDRFGSVPKARFKEDKSMVQRFQSQEGLQADGAYGPTTAAHVARYVSDVPPPFYWRKGAGQSDLGTYRSNLETIALDADQLGNSDRAARLRASALKASLA